VRDDVLVEIVGRSARFAFLTVARLFESSDDLCGEAFVTERVAVPW